MNLTLDRKQKILGGLLCLLAGTVTYCVTHIPKQERVAQLTYTGVPPKAGLKGKIAKDVPARTHDLLVLDLLKKMPPHGGRVLRNLFFIAPEAPRKTPEEIEKELAIKAEAELPKYESLPLPEPEPEPEPKEESRIDKINAELSRFKVIGYYEQANRRRLFLERGRQILVVSQGDLIDGKYMVENISDKMMRLHVADLEENVFINYEDF